MSIIVSIRDMKAGSWIKPYEVLNQSVAIRGFVSSFRRNSNVPMLKDFPEDYALYWLAEFRDSFEDGNFDENPICPGKPTLILSGEEALAMADMLDKRDAERSHYKISDN